MKKTAIILFGEYRTFETVSKFYEFPKDRYDLFIATWDVSEEQRLNYITYKDGVVYFKSVVHDNQHLYNESSVCYWSHYARVHNERIKNHIGQLPKIECGLKDVIVKSSSEFPHPTSTSKQVYLYKEGLELVRRQFGEGPISQRYDSILLSRIDSTLDIIHDKLKSNIIENPNTLFHSGETGMVDYTFANDLWWYGSVNVMESWIDGLNPKTHNKTHDSFAEYTGEWVGDIFKDIGGALGVDGAYLRSGAVDFVNNWSEIKRIIKHDRKYWMTSPLYMEVNDWVSSVTHRGGYWEDKSNFEKYKPYKKIIQPKKR